ncbi:DUF4276 family protein [Rudaea cellulosilytica]|uniref:DUF4276 family protein n=1 Tax=Rudaea cellulosilytica TaxID=540746 RepID=UPI000A05043C|nr:DUF4276 family protein [Rudaea cellulosilytica]
MKIGIIADGQAEVVALRELLSRIDIAGIQFSSILYADMQPYAPPGQIFQAAKSRLSICEQRGCERRIVLLDYEDRNGCPGVWAKTIEETFSTNGYSNVTVVVKNRAFENWLVADLGSLREKHGKRYKIADRLIERVKASGADNVNARNLLNNCVKDEYSKRKDAIEICKVVNPSVVAANSRSFRRLLKVIEMKPQNLKPGPGRKTGV